MMGLGEVGGKHNIYELYVIGRLKNKAKTIKKQSIEEALAALKEEETGKEESSTKAIHANDANEQVGVPLLCMFLIINCDRE